MLLEEENIKNWDRIRLRHFHHQGKQQHCFCTGSRSQSRPFCSRSLLTLHSFLLQEAALFSRNLVSSTFCIPRVTLELQHNLCLSPFQCSVRTDYCNPPEVSVFPQQAIAMLEH